MAGLVPRIIVLALGAGALGGPDMLRLLLAFAGSSNPIGGIAICTIVIGMVTAQLLGAMLLTRFVRKARAENGAGSDEPGASATDCFAKMTLLVSLAVAFLVTACLLVASGGLDSLRLLANFAGKRPIFLICAFTAFFLGTCRCFSFRSWLLAIPPNPSDLFLIAMPDLLPMAIVLSVGGAVAGGPEALGLLLAVAGRSAVADVLICVFLICAFTAFFLGTLLLARFFRVARNAAAPAPAPRTELFAAMTLAAALTAVLFITACLIAIPSVPAGGGSELGGAARSCFA